MNGDKFAQLGDVIRALGFACHPLTHLTVFDDYSGCIVVGFIWEYNEYDYVISFEPDDDIRELACEWFFEDYEPFDKEHDKFRFYVYLLAKYGDTTLDDKREWDDLNKYRGGYV